jgi:hypothetical protein
MHLPLVCRPRHNKLHTTTQVNGGKHAERLVLANTIHLFSPAHNRETRRLTVPVCEKTPKCGQLYAVVNWYKVHKYRQLLVT